MQANRFSPIACVLALLATATPALSQDDPALSPVLEQMNQRLAQLGLNVRVSKAELLTGLYGNHNGITLIANDRDKVLPSHWVPFDTRRNAAGRNIRYLVDQSDATPNGGLSSAQAEGAIDRAMVTWDVSRCGGGIPIVKAADTGVDPDIVDGLLGFGSVGTPYLADVVHGGWMPPAFFDLLFPGGGSFILGATFTSVLLDAASGNDINGDHQFDVGFREIYYNNYFAWGINADPPVADVESVALHEGGHGLSLGHFGRIFLDQDNKLQFSPFAVMNSVMFGQNHLIQGSDNSAYCDLWASWPNK